MTERKLVRRESVVAALAEELVANSDAAVQLREQLKEAPNCEWTDFNALFTNAVLSEDSEIRERQPISTNNTRGFARANVNADVVEFDTTDKVYSSAVTTPVIIPLIDNSSPNNDFDFVTSSGIHVLNPGVFQASFKGMLNFYPLVGEAIGVGYSSSGAMEATFDILVCIERDGVVYKETVATLTTSPSDFLKQRTRIINGTIRFKADRDDVITLRLVRTGPAGLYTRSGSPAAVEAVGFKKLRDTNIGSVPQRDATNYFDLVRLSD